MAKKTLPLRARETRVPDRKPGVYYTREIADRICEELKSGKTLRAVCRGEGMPSRTTVLEWRDADIDGFKRRHDEARVAGYMAMADEALDLADTSGKEAGEVAKARLQFDARRWLLSKALPKIFGDRVTLAGDPDAPIVVEDNRQPIDTFLVEFAAQKGVGDETKH